MGVISKGVIVSRSTSTPRGGGILQATTRGEIDAFAALLPGTDVVFFCPEFPDRGVMRRSVVSVQRRTTKRRHRWARERFGLQWPSWADSSVGRASRWHAEGRRFEPGWVHLSISAKRRLLLRNAVRPAAAASEVRRGHADDLPIRNNSAGSELVPASPIQANANRSRFLAVSVRLHRPQADTIESGKPPWTMTGTRVSG